MRLVIEKGEVSRLFLSIHEWSSLPLERWEVWANDCKREMHLGMVATLSCCRGWKEDSEANLRKRHG